MNKLSSVLNIVFFIAIMVLYYFHFNNNDKAKEEISPVKQSIIDSNKQLSIAYLDLEKLLTDYKLSEELNNKFISRKTELQNHLESQISDYEAAAKKFQEKLKRGSFLNQQSAENQQNALLEQQQDLQNLQYDLENQLAEEQQKMNSKLYDSIINYLSEYNKVQNFQYIFSKIDGGNLLIADSSFEITNEVIEELNKRYELAHEDKEK